MFKLPNYSSRKFQTGENVCSVLPEASYPAILSGDAVFLYTRGTLGIYKTLMYNNDGGFAALLSMLHQNVNSNVPRKVDQPRPLYTNQPEASLHLKEGVVIEVCSANFLSRSGTRKFNFAS